MQWEVENFEVAMTIPHSHAIVPVRILNTLDKAQTIGAQTVVVVSKPASSVVELEIPEQTSDCSQSAVRKINEGGDERGETLPHPLRTF